MKFILAIGLIGPLLSVAMSAPTTKSGGEMWTVYKNGKIYTADKDTDENWSKLVIFIEIAGERVLLSLFFQNS